MTVCVAAICSGRVVGVADRMLTSGDIEFEPQQSKIIPITTSIAVMIAGDASIHSELIGRIRFDIDQSLKADDPEWIGVRWVSGLYGKYFREMRSQRAEAKVLGPLGLTLSSFITEAQRGLPPEFVYRIKDELANFRLADPVEAIITGIDTDGPQPKDSNKETRYPQLYEVYDGEVTCLNMTGFAAIGIGRAHASSQFMFSGYDSAWDLPRALLVAYSAKRRSEVSPGVGKATDMFLIGPALGSYFRIGDHVLLELGKNYDQTQRNIARAAKKSERRMVEFDKELGKRQHATKSQVAVKSEKQDPQSTTADSSRQPASPESPGGSGES